MRNIETELGGWEPETPELTHNQITKRYNNKRQKVENKQLDNGDEHRNYSPEKYWGFGVNIPNWDRKQFETSFNQLLCVQNRWNSRTKYVHDAMWARRSFKCSTVMCTVKYYTKKATKISCKWAKATLLKVTI